MKTFKKFTSLGSLISFSLVSFSMNSNEKEQSNPTLKESIAKPQETEEELVDEQAKKSPQHNIEQQVSHESQSEEEEEELVDEQVKKSPRHTIEQQVSHESQSEEEEEFEENL